MELRKGAELIGAATLAVFSDEAGCGSSAKRYVKQFSRGVLASIISLIQSFEDGSAIVKDGNVGAIKTGAVWSACDAIQQLPKGNRNAMRRECMVWIRDCIESIEEFEEMMNRGEREDGDEDEMEEEEMYSEIEMKIVKAAVNMMKCSKNVLGLVMRACDCVGELIENPQKIDLQQDASSTTHSQEMIISEMLTWISHLHELARSIGVGVTDYGVLLYPPLELNNNPSESTLGQQLKSQLEMLDRCMKCINEATLPISGFSLKSCMSEEVVEMMQKLRKGVEARNAEVESTLS